MVGTPSAQSVSSGLDTDGVPSCNITPTTPTINRRRASVAPEDSEFTFKPQLPPSSGGIVATARSLLAAISPWKIGRDTKGKHNTCRSISLLTIT